MTISCPSVEFEVGSICLKNNEGAPKKIPRPPGVRENTRGLSGLLSVRTLGTGTYGTWYQVLYPVTSLSLVQHSTAQHSTISVFCISNG